MAKIALVTGASRGIGLAISRQLKQQGFDVIGMARHFDSDNDADLTEKISLDLSRTDTLSSRLKEHSNLLSGVELVVLNAGIGVFGSLENMSEQDIMQMLNLNLLSPILITRFLLPHLRRRDSAKLIFIGSESAYKPGRKGSVYCASKFGLRGFVQSVRQDVARSGISVSLINPGMTRSGFHDELDFEPGPDPSEHLLPGQIAEVVGLIAASENSVVFDEVNLNPRNFVINFKKPGMPSA